MSKKLFPINVQWFLKELLNVRSISYLYLVWGVLMTLGRLSLYFKRHFLMSHQLEMVLKYADLAFIVIAIGLSIYYVFMNKSKMYDVPFSASRYAWFAAIVVDNFLIIFIKIKTDTVDFELLHPIQMALIGLVLIFVGAVHRERWIQLGGIFFWAGAYIAIKQPLTEQFLIEAIVAALGLVLPAKLIAWKHYRQRR